MEKVDFIWKIGGEAGFGIMITGSSFCKTLTRAGLEVISTAEYPSLIRGGHNTFIVRAANHHIDSLLKPVNLLVALNKDTIDLHKDELDKSGTIIYDPSDIELKTGDFSTDTKLLAIPLLKLAKENNGDALMRNTVALGASAAYLGIDFSVLESVIHDQFIKKGQEVVDQNVKTARAGFDFVNNISKIPTRVTVSASQNKMVITGNESISLGAVSSGMKFFSAYPMTPINGIISFMANYDQRLSVVYKQPEDEIAAINMAIGASYAGVRSMTASSGGGFALMNEGLSMAGIIEVPLVIIYGQRPGPASGLPTWTSQGDLYYALHAGHGEFLRFVFAPGDVEEAYWLTKLAFNMADIYQTPAIVLVDKYLCESTFSLDKEKFSSSQVFSETIIKKAQEINRGKLVTKPDENYKRYALTDDGISPRIFPDGQMWFTTNSYEHNEAGLSTELAVEIKAMGDKRNKKALLAERESFGPIVYGPESADITLLGWGTTKQAVLEALAMMTKSGEKVKVNYYHFPCLNPFPSKNALSLLKKAKRLVDVELNSTHPFTSLLREKTGVVVSDEILKYDGRPFFPEEIVSALRVLRGE